MLIITPEAPPFLFCIVICVCIDALKGFVTECLLFKPVMRWQLAHH